LAVLKTLVGDVLTSKMKEYRITNKTAITFEFAEERELFEEDEKLDKLLFLNYITPPQHC
jgi:hypothetical protein